MVEAMLKFYNSFMSHFIKRVNLDTVFNTVAVSHDCLIHCTSSAKKCLELKRKFRFLLVLVQNLINVQNWWFCFDLMLQPNIKTFLFNVSSQDCFKQWWTSKKWLYSKYWWYFENFLLRVVLWNVFCFHINMYRFNKSST